VASSFGIEEKVMSWTAGPPIESIFRLKDIEHQTKETCGNCCRLLRAVFLVGEAWRAWWVRHLVGVVHLFKFSELGMGPEEIGDAQ